MTPHPRMSAEGFAPASPCKNVSASALGPAAGGDDGCGDWRERDY